MKPCFIALNGNAKNKRDVSAISAMCSYDHIADTIAVMFYH